MNNSESMITDPVSADLLDNESEIDHNFSSQTAVSNRISCKFENFSTDELQQALPEQSPVIAKVKLVQSKCAILNSTSVDNPAAIYSNNDAVLSCELSAVSRNATNADPRLAKSSLLDKMLSCFSPFVPLCCRRRSSATVNKSEVAWEVPFGSITNLEWIGSGAQGVVFRGLLRGETIAVKKVNNRSDTEIEHLRQLRHPNIIQFKGVCVEHPCFCLLMEYCPYGQLYDLLHSATHIALGMQYLHANKIVHRDLKSPNILVGEHHILKISDFGASREWTESSVKMSFAGTVAWMAPEVIRNEPCSLKVDVWSYGVLLWELLTGEIPYNNVDSTAIIWGVGSERLHLHIPETCPTELRILIKRCRNIKPRSRPSFKQIVSNFEFIGHELTQYSDSEFAAAQLLWKEEIALHLQGIHLQSKDNKKPELILLQRRRQELGHAQDIRRHYEDKLERVNELCNELQLLMREVEDRRREAVDERLRLKKLQRALIQQTQNKALCVNVLSSPRIFPRSQLTDLQKQEKQPPDVDSKCVRELTPSSVTTNAFERLESNDASTTEAAIAPSLHIDVSKNVSQLYTAQCPLCGSTRTTLTNPNKVDLLTRKSIGLRSIYAFVRSVLALRSGRRLHYLPKVHASMDGLNIPPSPPTYDSVIASDWVEHVEKIVGRCNRQHSCEFLPQPTADQSVGCRPAVVRSNSTGMSLPDQRCRSSNKTATPSSGVSSGIILAPIGHNGGTWRANCGRLHDCNSRNTSGLNITAHPACHPLANTNTINMSSLPSSTEHILSSGVSFVSTKSHSDETDSGHISHITKTPVCIHGQRSEDSLFSSAVHPKFPTSEHKRQCSCDSTESLCSVSDISSVISKYGASINTSDTDETVRTQLTTSLAASGSADHIVVCQTSTVERTPTHEAPQSANQSSPHGRFTMRVQCALVWRSCGSTTGPSRPVVSSLGPSSAAVGRPDKLGLQFQRTRETPDSGVILRTQPGRRKPSPSICALKQSSVEPSQPTSQLPSSSENGSRRMTSLCSTFSSPSSASVDTHTNVSTENLARDLQAHLRDSLSEKEQQVRCVRNRIWQENDCSENPVSLGVSPVAPLVVLSAELQPSAAPLNDSIVKMRRRSFDPFVRSARQSFTQSLLFPVSLSTTGMISSISESTENLARDLQAHLRDSLSEKEQQVRCVRNRIWQENDCSENPVSLGVSPVAPLVVLSAELQPSAAPLNDSTVKMRRRSFDPFVRSARQSFTQSLLFPVSLSTTGMISSISEAETDPSEYSDDVRESASGAPEDDFELALSASQPGFPVGSISRGNLPDKHDDMNIQRSLSTIYSVTENQS
ncbi:hypothetical protein AHF37_02709 [Paragonimus kellicotti]|nr:hypothetical protein AHF37_02709 [Paragonimus kellicotti]